MNNPAFSSYRLINYFDVWFNAEEGWTVNNQCEELNWLSIHKDATDKEILEMLRLMRFLKSSDMRKLAIRDFGRYIEIQERKSGKPLYGLYCLD